MTIHDDREIVDRRLTALRLAMASPRLDTPEAVVRWLGVVQSQDYGPAKWSIAKRMDGTITDAAIDRAFDAGRVLRTHVLRPTWHFVVPEDIHWLVSLTGPRIQALSAFMYRTTGLDEAIRARSNDIIARALEGGRHLTRAELRVEVEQAGIPTVGFRMGYLMMHAEVSLLVCSGALRGKVQTYALLEERAPQARRLDRGEALAELTRRYFTSHGPATVKDFRVWCSLSAADARLGLELVGSELERETLRDLTFWAGANESSVPAVVDPSPTVHLLQGYDEYIMGYTETKALIDLSGSAGYSPTDRAIYVGVIVLDGQFIGNWKRTVGASEAVLHVQLVRPFNDAEHKALQAAADRHGAFLGRTATIAIVD
jgi:hypothetical protein